MRNQTVLTFPNKLVNIIGKKMSISAAKRVMVTLLVHHISHYHQVNGALGTTGSNDWIPNFHFLMMMMMRLPEPTSAGNVHIHTGEVQPACSSALAAYYEMRA